MFNKVTHVLFDLDGLLIDSEKFYTEAFTNVCANYGKTFTWEIKAGLLGLQGQKCADKIIEILNLPLTQEEFLHECQKEYIRLFPQVQLMPGAKKLVDHLHEAGVPIAIATSSSEDSVSMKMENHKEFLKKFHHVIMGSSDPEVTKANPILLYFWSAPLDFQTNLNLKMLCLVLEDALNGVIAACAANMQVVVVPDPRLDKKLFKDATLVLDSLEEFQPQLFGLPSYTN